MYIFKDGKMGMEDKLGRAEHMQPGHVMKRPMVGKIIMNGKWKSGDWMHLPERPSRLRTTPCRACRAIDKVPPGGGVLSFALGFRGSSINHSGSKTRSAKFTMVELSFD